MKWRSIIESIAVMFITALIAVTVMLIVYTLDKS